ncbi:MAG: DUF6531 domain-containing protein [Pyrinomonadaceae bacterium]
MTCRLAFILATIVFAFTFPANAQQEGPAAVQSNGVTIGFQNDGGNAATSNGVSISFQNQGGDAKASNGVSISFQNAGSAESGTSSGVTIGFRDGFNPRGCLGNCANSGMSPDPVNTATGNFIFDKTDLTVAGRGIGFEFKRFYNSQDGTPGPLGVGWTHSYNLKVAENVPANTVTVTLDDGHDEVYDKVGSNYNPKYPGIYNKLNKNPDNTFTVTRKDKRKFNFRLSGKLGTIVDRNNNTATLDYDASERLTRVNIPGGRAVDLTYDGSNRLSQVSDTLAPSPRTVTYGYDGNNNLISVTDVRGNVWQYTYDAEHHMLTARDPRNNVFVTNTYVTSPMDNTAKVVSYQTDAKGNPTTFEYLENPVRTKVTDPLGNVSYDYHDSFKRMIRQRDRLAKSYSYTYDGNNNRTSVTDKNNRTTQYEYDPNGNVTKQIDPFGRPVVITYNTNNDPLTRTDELGQATSFEYDTNGNLTKTTEPLAKVTNFSYDGFGQLLTVTDALGRLTTNTYDSSGNLTTVKDALNNITTYGYDTIGRRTSTTDARSKTTSFAYDKAGNLLTVTDPLNQTVSNEYDPNGNRTRMIDARGAITLFEYDPNNLLTRVTDALGGTVINTYDALDRRSTVKNQLNFTTAFEYDLEGRATKITDPLGNITRYEYDSQGNRTKVIDPKSNATIFEYDALNRLIRTTDALGNRTTSTYDALGRVTNSSDALGRNTKFFFDELGRVVKVSDPNNKDTIFTYDLVGNRLTVKNPNNQTTTFAYDSVNRLSTKTNPLGKTYIYSYDAVGNLSRKVDANGAQIDYTYDGNNRLLTVAYPNSTSVVMSYDANGNRTQMIDSVGTSTYAFDALNRMTGYVDAYGKTINYEYDPASNRTALVYPDGKRVTYTFDSANRMTNVADWANRNTAYAYDPASMLSGQTNANGTTAAFAYDNAGRLTTMNNKKSDQAVISSYSFTLDPVGNRTNINQTEPLIAGNPAVDTVYAYNVANQIQTAGPAAFTSDFNGNLKTQTTGGVTRNFNYDFEDRLTTAGDGATSAQYIYNGDGLRLAKTVNGVTTRFVLDPTSRLQRVLADTDASGTITNYYTHGLGMIAKITPAAEYYQYHFDFRGSTVAISNSTQNIVNRYSYDPFGVVIAASEQTPNPFQYMGQFGVTKEPYDLLFASRRFYNPVLGRFLSKDPIEGVMGNPQSFNEYVYSLNNPVMLMDPSGLTGQSDGNATFNPLGPSDLLNRFLVELRNEARSEILMMLFRNFASRNFLTLGQTGLRDILSVIRIPFTSRAVSSGSFTTILGLGLSIVGDTVENFALYRDRDITERLARTAIDVTYRSTIALISATPYIGPGLGIGLNAGYSTVRTDVQNYLIQENPVVNWLGNVTYNLIY